jgi:hypothetical protein
LTDAVATTLLLGLIARDDVGMSGRHDPHRRA